MEANNEETRHAVLRQAEGGCEYRFVVHVQQLVVHVSARRFGSVCESVCVYLCVLGSVCVCVGVRKVSHVTVE